MVTIASVVEGHGEVESVPLLIRNIANEVDPRVQIDLPHPVRIPKGKLLKEGGLERAVDFAALLAGNNGAVLILIDSDGDCPAHHASRLVARVSHSRPDLRSALVLAHREFESWFLAAAVSLRGFRGLPVDLEAPEHPEDVIGAKEWLSRKIARGNYSPTIDQAKFTSRMNLESAKRASSFEKFYREVRRLIGECRTTAP
ncbi:MAG TPA: DUF4276 family protein [Bryobacteraceae bacterium]|nr:DUF4276 family protein [Bryobacteraceae bacterium]